MDTNTCPASYSDDDHNAPNDSVTYSHASIQEGRYLPHAAGSQEALIEEHAQKHDDRATSRTTIVGNQTSLDRNTSDGGTIQKCALFQVMLSSAMIMCSLPINGFVTDQWVYKVYSDELLGNSTVNTRINPCMNNPSSNKSVTDLVEQVQKQASQMTLYLNFLTFGVSIFTNSIIGCVSEKISRRVVLIIPTTGYFLRSTLTTAIIYWNLDINWLYLANGIDGLGGSLVGLFLGVFLYTSDITPRDHKRTVGIAIAEVSMGVLRSAMELVAGQLVQNFAFLIPSLVATGIMLIPLISVWFLPDRRPQTSLKEDKQTLRTLTKKIISPFVQGNLEQRKLVGIAALAFFLNLAVGFGVLKFTTLYLMNLPLCFESSSIGVFDSLREFASNIISVGSVFLLSQRLPGLWLAMLGSVSKMASYLMIGLAENQLEVWLGIPIGIFQNLTTTVLRGETSRLLGPEYQGPLFAIMAVIESISFATGLPLLLLVYRNTQNFITGTGTAWLLAAILMFVCTLTMGVFQMRWYGYRRRNQYRQEEKQTVTDS